MDLNIKEHLTLDEQIGYSDGMDLMIISMGG